MAHLLGSKACIDSLRTDIEDLQNVIYEIIGKTGSLKCHSWKFPDRLATDVDTHELLQRYQYGKNELDNQVSHIVLFEIIIDRLLLVLHGSWRFLHEMQTQIVPKSIDSASTINQQSSLSVGLVVKKYWSKLWHIFIVLQQHEKDRQRSPPPPPPPVQSSEPKSNNNPEKSSQTVESSFGPCSSCTKLQDCLRHQGQHIIQLCHQSNIPSTLAHHRCLKNTKPEWLTNDDLQQWSEYQSKDFDSLTKHLHSLTTSLSKTKSDLKASESQCKQQQESNRQLQQLINDDKHSKRILQELHNKKMMDLKKELEQQTGQLNEQVETLTLRLTKLDQEVKDLNEESRTKTEQIERLESSKTELKGLIQDRLQSKDIMKNLEQDRIRLQTELDVIKRDLEERHRDLQKERTRVENMIRQEQNSQSKQQAMATSFDELSQECQTLRQKLVDLECERDELQKSLETLRKQNESSPLKHSDGNGTIVPTSAPNDLLVDMQNQMRNNECHIDLLRKQNESLNDSAQQLMSHSPTGQADEQKKGSSRRYSYGHEVGATKSRPSPLFLLNNEIIEQQAFTEIRPVTVAGHMLRTTARSDSRSDPDVIPLTQPVARPSTRTYNKGRTMTVPPTTVFAMNFDQTRTSKIPPSSAKSASNSVYRCATCQKSYDDKRNYDIHKLYCRA